MRAVQEGCHESRPGAGVMRAALLLSALAVFVPGAGSAQVEFYQEGNRLYQEGDFEEPSPAT